MNTQPSQQIIDLLSEDTLVKELMPSFLADFEEFMLNGYAYSSNPDITPRVIDIAFVAFINGSLCPLDRNAAICKFMGTEQFYKAMHKTPTENLN